jgi:flagellar biosynthesis/type III secretory pathway M-ring protein FliF/YscJ
MRRGLPESWDTPKRRSACTAVEIVLALVIVAIVAWFVTGPLRRSRSQTEAADAGLEDPAIAEIEARKEAKYREIRDAELRRVAIEILKRLDRLRGRRSAGD